MFRILSSHYSFSIEAKLHPYLLEGLKKNGLLPLRPFQQKAFHLFNDRNNLMINQIDGSGKTLAYLLPIISRILYSKKQPPPKSGAIILTLNKELVLSIYKQIRMIDFDNILNVNRTGSITHYSAVVDEMCKKRQEQDQDLIIDLMEQNVANSVVWPHTDILITTPSMLYSILSQKAGNKQSISPGTIVIDEADLILSKREDLLGYSKKNLALINTLGQKGGKVKYILSSHNDSFLKGIKIESLKEQSFIQTSYHNQTSIVNKMKLLSLKVDGDSQEEQFKNKLSRLLQILKDRLHQRIIVYANSNSIEKIKSAFKTHLSDLIFTQYYAKMSTQKRMASIFDFNHNRAKVLLTTQLANRGFSFDEPIDMIVSFDGCDSRQEEIIRMCRCNKEGAQYILMEGQKFNMGDQGSTQSRSKVSEIFKNIKAQNWQS